MHVVLVKALPKCLCWCTPKVLLNLFLHVKLLECLSMVTHSDSGENTLPIVLFLQKWNKIWLNRWWEVLECMPISASKQDIFLWVYMCVSLRVLSCVNSLNSSAFRVILTLISVSFPCFWAWWWTHRKSIIQTGFNEHSAAPRHNNTDYLCIHLCFQTCCWVVWPSQDPW